MNIAIVEDNENDAARLENYIRRIEKSFSILAERKEAIQITIYRDGAEFLENYKPVFSIILMDIEMPNLDGMRAARKLREIDSSTELIFVTNLAQFAVKGYDVNATAFIVKPILYDDFALKIKRAIERSMCRSNYELTIGSPFEMIRISVEQLLYVEVKNHQLYYHLLDSILEGKGRESLVAIEKKLAPFHFLRCNNCYLVNPVYISKVEGYDLLIGNETLQISHPRKKKFMEQFVAWMVERNG